MMIIFKVLAAALAVLVAILLLLIAWGLIFGLPGKAPATLGIQNDARLAPCRAAPNCVNSDAEDGYAAIAPLPLRGSAQESLARIRVALDAMPSTSVQRMEGNYLHATQTSRMLGFVDDIEFLADAQAGIVRLKSASRLGHKDFDVNRKRIEALRQAYLDQP